MKIQLFKMVTCEKTPSVEVSDGGGRRPQAVLEAAHRCADGPDAFLLKITEILKVELVHLCNTNTQGTINFTWLTI